MNDILKRLLKKPFKVVYTTDIPFDDTNGLLEKGLRSIVARLSEDAEMNGITRTLKMGSIIYTQGGHSFRVRDTLRTLSQNIDSAIKSNTGECFVVTKILDNGDSHMMSIFPRTIVAVEAFEIVEKHEKKARKRSQ